jgi:hypothetical protein
MRELAAEMRVLRGGAGKVLKNALCFVKSAKLRVGKSGVLFDLRAKDAKKWKSASFFAIRGLSEVAVGRIVEMGNWRALRLTAELLVARGMGVLLCAGGELKRG